MILVNLSQIKQEFINLIADNLKISSREASLEVNQILLFTLKINNSELLLKKTITKSQYNKLIKIVSIRTTGKPLAYIFKEWGFYGRTFYINESMLIPRPETELIIDVLKERKILKDNIQLLDLGAGSGAIGITAKLEIYNNADLHLSDISKSCTCGIRKNLQQFDIQANVYLSNWFENIPKIKFDLILSNPPYISNKDPHLNELRFEPKRALVAKKQGLADIHTIIENSVHFLNKDGLIIIEHGYNQKDEVQEIFNRYNFNQIESYKDLLGHYRITKGLFS
ncbi:peptide chain release factor N(5)-glutamine methyltransferase [Methylophilaceae bacterium]|nr:peptide chain release factor N(5)-glutamine methyltransferase [Methylophilaceae bacterium]